LSPIFLNLARKAAKLHRFQSGNVFLSSELAPAAGQN